MKRLALLLCLAAMPCFANELPIKPEPQPRAHTAANREFWVEAGAMGAAWTMDTVSTSQLFAGRSYKHETGWIYYGSRSTPKIMGTWAAIDLGTLVIAYEWKRHVRNRYLNPLWRAPMAWRTFGHTQSAFGNWRQ
jgi:hypothetical protein